MARIQEPTANLKVLVTYNTRMINRLFCTRWEVLWHHCVVRQRVFSLSYRKLRRVTRDVSSL